MIPRWSRHSRRSWPHAYLDGWRCRYAPAADGSALPSPTPRDSLAISHTAAQVESNSARPGAARPRPGASGAAAADGAVQTAEAERARAARPKPVPPTLAPAQRDAAMSKARLLNSERKEIRDQLQQGSLSLAQALAQDGEAARGMRVATVVRALPDIGGATARRLMATAGIDGGRRVGGLTAGQRERLLAAVAAVGAELAARHGHRVTIPASVRDVPRPRRGGGAVPRAVLAHPAPGQIRSARSSGGPRR